MLVLATIVIGGLFFNDNAEFFEQANKNYADGMRWSKIEQGCRAPNPEEIYISAINESTGEEWVCFKMRK
tara:strand:- start:1271 stop:1480 length:210 start_codon:yes stop_codon:yes gene_type:complete